MRPDFDPVEQTIAYHAAINALDFSAIEAFLAEDAVYVSGGVGGTIAGRAPIMAAFRRYFTAYPDQVAEDSEIVAVGPQAARAVWQLKATHAETGEPLIRGGAETVTFDDAGRIVRVEVTDY
jgi:ketosteroid isomerase-like protein